MAETGVLTLTDFLLARIAEDEALARSAGLYLRALHAHDATPGLTVEGNRVWTVDRAVAECAAKRELISALTVWMDRDVAPWNIDCLRIMAAVYAGHPDFREEWRP